MKRTGSERHGKAGRLAGTLSMCLILSLLLTLGSCSCSDTPEHLVIQDGSLATWMPTANSFSNGTAADPKGTGDDGRPNRLFRTGVLIQVGDHSGSDMYYAGLEFRKDGEAISAPSFMTGKTLGASRFTSINIVSENPHDPCGDASRDTIPMDPADVVSLYPSTVESSCELDLSDPCLRNRMLHAYIPPKALITYWQGEAGYAVSVKQGAGKTGYHDAQAFTFNDPFRVEVYRANDTTGDLELVHTFRPGEVDQIVVVADPSGPGGGDQHEPAWPPIQG